MSTRLTYRSHVLKATDTPDSLKQQYGQLRYECFQKNDPNVPLNHESQTELDQFDFLDSTIYIMITNSDTATGAERLISAVRILPTTSAYELEAKSYRYLTNGIALPKADNIYEASRWVGRSSRTTAGMLSTGLLIMEMSKTAKRRQFDQVIGVITTKSETWMNNRSSKSARASETYKTDRDVDEIMATIIDIDSDFHDAGRRLFEAALDNVSVINIEVALERAA